MVNFISIDNWYSCVKTVRQTHLSDLVAIWDAVTTRRQVVWHGADKTSETNNCVCLHTGFLQPSQTDISERAPPACSEISIFPYSSWHPLIVCLLSSAPGMFTCAECVNISREKNGTINFWRSEWCVLCYMLTRRIQTKLSFYTFCDAATVDICFSILNSVQISNSAQSLTELALKRMPMSRKDNITN